MFCLAQLLFFLGILAFCVGNIPAGVILWVIAALLPWKDSGEE